MKEFLFLKIRMLSRSQSTYAKKFQLDKCKEAKIFHEYISKANQG